MIFDVLKTYWQIVEIFSTKPGYESDGLVEIFSTRKSWVQSDSYPGFRKILKNHVRILFWKNFPRNRLTRAPKSKNQGKNALWKKFHKTA